MNSRTKMSVREISVGLRHANSFKLSSLRAQLDAIFEVLGCEDETKKSPGFQEFYGKCPEANIYY